LDGTLHQTWSPVGVQPRVPTRGERKTAHIFGAISLEADFFWYAVSVFNGHTFHEFLQRLVTHYADKKVLLVMDNGPCHWLDETGKRWLSENESKIQLFRLPPYSPEFNPVEGCWKATRRLATHNRHYPTVEARDAALKEAFASFETDPAKVDGYVRRYREEDAPVALAA